MDNINLTLAIEQDLELIMAWRSNPLIYKNFYIQKRPLEWKEHIDWWTRNKKSWDRLIFIIWYNSRKVGSISLHSFSTGIPEVDIYIGEVTLWGKGIGKKAIDILLNMEYEVLKRYKVVCARILKGNIRSQKVFESCGFSKRGEGRPGEWYYERLIK